DPRITLRAEIRDRDESGEPIRLILTAKDQPLFEFNPTLNSDPPRSSNEIMQLLGQVAIGDNELDLLSAREQEVMRLIARGYTYKEVGNELFISVKTVETHVSAVLRKLQLSNRNELTRWAMQRHIV
ncbi:response regulator transcription factor, partial [uncultured Rothia sp.]|uniref:response regulator transcription factor n=1 Tax=uncultured Rothia sp. TaxID=316088 RepID=UPI002624E634